VKPSAVELDALRAKYAEMLRLRLLHASDHEPDPRRDLAALAARFPGALREIDSLSLDEIRKRIGALEAAAHDRSRVEPWMTALALFHALTRGVLLAKRWLAGRKHVDARTRAAFAAAARTLAFPDDARAWTDDLARVAAPPSGRVTNLVFERVAVKMGTSVGEARALVFGPPRRGSGRRR
jgi:hypothetical protein